MLTVTTSNSLPMSKLQLGERVGDAVHDHRAEHRAAVVHEVEQDRLAVIEVLAEADDVAGFVAEHEVERELGVEVLRDGDFAGELRRGFGVLLGEEGSARGSERQKQVSRGGAETRRESWRHHREAALDDELFGGFDREADDAFLLVDPARLC